MNSPRLVRMPAGWVVTASGLKANGENSPYTFCWIAGIMRFRSCERSCKWKPEFSAAEMSSGSPY